MYKYSRNSAWLLAEALRDFGFKDLNFGLRCFGSGGYTGAKITNMYLKIILTKNVSIDAHYTVRLLPLSFVSQELRSCLKCEVADFERKQQFLAYHASQELLQK